SCSAPATTNTSTTTTSTPAATPTNPPSKTKPAASSPPPPPPHHPADRLNDPRSGSRRFSLHDFGVAHPGGRQQGERRHEHAEPLSTKVAYDLLCRRPSVQHRPRAGCSIRVRELSMSAVQHRQAEPQSGRRACE